MAVVKKLGYYSMAKYCFWTGMLIGAIAGITLTVSILLNPESATGITSKLTLAPIATGILSIPITALLFGIIQFLISFPSTLFLNIVLKLSGGIEVDVELPESTNDYQKYSRGA